MTASQRERERERERNRIWHRDRKEMIYFAASK